MSKELQVAPRHQVVSAFSSADAFEEAQRMAKLLSASDMVPEKYRGPRGISNCVIALEMANRIGASVFAVMQNLVVVHGKPAWEAKFIIATVNHCGRYGTLQYKVEDLGPKKVNNVSIHDKRCTAFATDLKSGEVLYGAPASIEMAVLEGWYTKNGSKWKTMPDLMLHYRAASFFGKMYASDLLCGMPSREEVYDVDGVEVIRTKQSETLVDDLSARLGASAPAPVPAPAPAPGTDKPSALTPEAEAADPNSLDDWDADYDAEAQRMAHGDDPLD